MFLTRMRLNPARRGTRFLLASPQRLHAAVLHGFPSTPQESDARVLWRLDLSRRHDLHLYVVSPAEPDFTHVIEQAGWPTLAEATWETRPYGPFLDRLDIGQVWAFRLRANPVRRERQHDGRIKTSSLTSSGQEKWLADRAAGLGISLVADGEGTASFALTHRTSQSFERKAAAPGNGRDVTIASARYDGMLEVVDADLLRSALTQGIGRAKAYGCGLLTLAAPRS